MKIDTSKIAESVKATTMNILREHRNEIATVVTSAVLVGLCKALNVPVEVNSASNNGGVYNPGVGTKTILPRNAHEKAIAAIYNNARDMWSDGTKLDAANKIYSIASQADVDDGTKMYAMQGLEWLAGKMWSDGSKAKVMNLITNLSTNRKGEN